MKKETNLAKKVKTTKELASDKAKTFTKSLMTVLTINGKKVNKKDINYIYENILYALLPQSDNNI